MDPSGSDNDECASVQLGSSDMAPSATKVTFLIYMLMSVLIHFTLDHPPAEVSNEALSCGI